MLMLKFSLDKVDTPTFKSMRCLLFFWLFDLFFRLLLKLYNQRDLADFLLYVYWKLRLAKISNCTKIYNFINHHRDS